MTTAESSQRQSKGKFVQGNFQTNETELNSGLCDVKLNSLFFFSTTKLVIRTSSSSDMKKESSYEC